MKINRKLLFHILAFLTAAVWGVTFISTKILINSGLTPAQIFAIRFTIAYSGIWLMCAVRGRTDRRLFSSSVRHEFLFLLMGISGGSLYFLTENSALANTQACNVSFIVCSAPLLTILMTLAIRKLFKGSLVQGLEDIRIGIPLVAGTLLALTGMFLVIFDGYTLNISPKGDLLAFSAALCWAFYSQFMSQMTSRYGTFFATRKVFFYGLLTIIPILLFSDSSNLHHVPFSSVKVWGNLLFLSVIASQLCFIVWNRVMSEIGNVTSTNYVYLNPVFTLLGAMLILGESLTTVSGLGSAMILGGVILAGIRKEDIITNQK